MPTIINPDEYYANKTSKMTLSCRLLFNSSNPPPLIKEPKVELSLIHLEWYINNKHTIPNDLH
ncbi:hypothetical protein FG127_02045 [Vibrio cholerae]|nr:hypothetical protein [Vibrio cholerae]